MADWQNPLTPLIWIVTGVAVMLILVAFIVLITTKYVRNIRKVERRNADLAISYQKDLLAQSIDIQENERERIASDLHDDLIGQLNRIKIMNADAKLKGLLGESIASARRISHDLCPPMISKLSFGNLVRDYVEPFKKNFKVVIIEKELGHGALTEVQKLHLLRISQEVITNIIKHDKVSELSIYSRNSQHYTALLISDNGRGIRDTNTSGLGLKNIEMRSQVINATYRFRPVKDQGTHFLIVIDKSPKHEQN